MGTGERWPVCTKEKSYSKLGNSKPVFHVFHGVAPRLEEQITGLSVHGVVVKRHRTRHVIVDTSRVQQSEKKHNQWIMGFERKTDTRTFEF